MSILKKWWVWVIALVILIGAFAGGGNDNGESVVAPDEVAEEQQEEAQEEVEEDPGVTDEVLAEIGAGLEPQMESERDYGYDIYLDRVDYEGGSIEIWVDYQFTPEDIEYIEDQGEAFTWYTVDVILGGADEDIRLTNVTKLGEDEYIHWGTNRYSNGEYKWSEGSGSEVLE